MNLKGILFTCRDPGATHQILPIIEAVKRDKMLSVQIVASGAALDILSGHDCIPFNKQVDGDRISYNYPVDESDLYLKAMIRQSSEMISQYRPAVILTGSSTLGYGVDEVFTYVAANEYPEIVTIKFLDAWNGSNSLANGYPDHLMVIDNSVKKALKYWPSDHIHVVGSPKHEKASKVDVAQLRKKTRKEMSVDENTLIIVFFAQTSLVPGYIQNYNTMIEVLSSVSDTPLKFLIKSHPKYDHYVDKLDQFAREKGIIPKIFSRDQDNQNIFAAADLILLCTSMIALDHAFFTRHSEIAIGHVVHLHMHRPCRKHVSESAKCFGNPLIKRGIGNIASTADDLRQYIQDAANKKSFARLYFKATKTLETTSAVKRTLDILYRFANKTSSSN